MKDPVTVKVTNVQPRPRRACLGMGMRIPLPFRKDHLMCCKKCSSCKKPITDDNVGDLCPDCYELWKSE